MLLFIYILFGTLCTTAPVSIHLMLLFISKHFHIYQIFYKFQYISCYSLSCFSRRSVIFHIPFQYISCYSLSTQKGIQEKRSRTFQYISCYSLSGSAALSETRSGVSIHLMLLFINNTLYK